MKKVSINNRLIALFDAVRLTHQSFVDSIKQEIELHDDYRLILTHGVIGELLYLITQNLYGLDKTKIYICTNNIETATLFLNHNFNIIPISEYIFLNDDFFNINDTIEKDIDCIFPGRPSKNYNLFSSDTGKITVLNKLNGFPFYREKVREFYNKAKTGLMTTEQEGSCLSVGEMLLSGLPIISVRINNTYPADNYFPIRNTKSYSTYDVLLRNTLGGRELWLNHNNSLFVNMDIVSIEEAISELINKDLCSKTIRNNYLSILNYNRICFLYYLKAIFDDLKVDFNNETFNQCINLPYGNTTVDSTEWKLVLTHFYSSFYNV